MYLATHAGRQSDGWERRMNDSEIPAVYHGVSLLPTPAAVGGVWAVLDPAKSLFHYFPPLEMLMCFQVPPWMHYQFHEEDLSASVGLEEK